MTRTTDPLKNFEKSTEKIQDKAIQSNILWLNLNKIGVISILQAAHKQIIPHFTFMRVAQNADTHAHKQPRLSQNISRLLHFCTGYRI